MISLTEDMITSMTKIRSMIKDVHGVVDQLEEAFDTCDSKIKAADNDISTRAKKALAASKA